MAWVAAIAVLVIGLSFLLNRRLGYILLAAAFVAGCGLWWYSSQQAEKSGQVKDAVAAEASADAASCPDPAAPILVQFSNGNRRAIARISFSLTGRLKGHSSVAYRGYLRGDKIIQPGQTSQTCFGLLPHGFAAPRPETVVVGDYDWVVDISLVDFLN
ncbi:hypothetical protein M0654_06070 [Rhizobium sp. NTR19]|uniref:Uncharacterized protein n=1 Tax=Neorhizobium turbinariae TaxID=2937795 RepID=A0ABT0INT8_9HYPH|nr:hypothetical protein [Neorhizobium turbinariae]MCK8779549.1 hypothetical protein [Neorhizobium turbinariae]